MPYSLNTSTPRAFSKSGIYSVSSFSACSFVISVASSSITTVTLSAPFAHHHRSITVFCQAVSYGNYLHVGENACTRQMRLGFFSNRERFVLYYPPCLRRASLVQFALPFCHVFAIRLYRPLAVLYPSSIRRFPFRFALHRKSYMPSKRPRIVSKLCLMPHLYIPMPRAIPFAKPPITCEDKAV